MPGRLSPIFHLSQLNPLPGKPWLLSGLCLLIMLYSQLAFSAWQPANVMGVAECGECHEDEVKVWKKTAHQKNFKALSRNKDAKAIAKKMGIKRIKKPNTLCASCHYTVGHKSGKEKIIAGVSCESCHGPAKEWLDLHNDFGGRGIKKNQESADHRRKRLAKLEQLGMIRPDNIYGWARNCLSCHIVANEKLINQGGHPAGSEFKLSKRTQGKIRHYPKSSVEELRFLNLVSYATELELSLRALAKARGGKYAKEMLKRAGNALDKLKSANERTSSPYARQSIKLASAAAIKAGNGALLAIADNIAVNTMKMVQKKNGYPYPASKLKGHKIKAAPKRASAAPKPKAKTKPVIKKPSPKKAAVKKITPAPKPKAPVPVPVSRPRAAVVKAPPMATAAAATKPARDTAPETPPGNKVLLKEFSLLAPLNEALCDTYTPWMLGSRTLINNAQVPANGCISIKIEAGKSSRLYLYAETINGEITQLMPNTCNAMNMGFNILLPDTVEYFPKNERLLQDVIPLKTLPNVYRFYAVITDSMQADNQLAQLANQVSSICDTKPVSKKPASQFSNSLNRIQQMSAGHMQWQVRSIQP